MKIIEKGTRQQIDTQEKIRSKAGKKWVWLVALALALIIILSLVLFYYNILTLSLARSDFFFIGIFVVALIYCLLHLKRFN